MYQNHHGVKADIVSLPVVRSSSNHEMLVVMLAVSSPDVMWRVSHALFPTPGGNTTVISHAGYVFVESPFQQMKKPTYLSTSNKDDSFLLLTTSQTQWNPIHIQITTVKETVRPFIALNPYCTKRWYREWPMTGLLTFLFLTHFIASDIAMDSHHAPDTHTSILLLPDRSSVLIKYWR